MCCDGLGIVPSNCCYVYKGVVHGTTVVCSGQPAMAMMATRVG